MKKSCGIRIHEWVACIRISSKDACFIDWRVESISCTTCLPTKTSEDAFEHVGTNFLVQGTWKFIDSKIYEESCGIRIHVIKRPRGQEICRIQCPGGIYTEVSIPLLGIACNMCTTCLSTKIAKQHWACAIHGHKLLVQDRTITGTYNIEDAERDHRRIVKNRVPNQVDYIWSRSVGEISRIQCPGGRVHRAVCFHCLKDWI